MVKTTRMSRQAWLSAMARSSPPMAWPIAVISLSPPGIAMKYEVTRSKRPKRGDHGEAERAQHPRQRQAQRIEDPAAERAESEREEGLRRVGEYGRVPAGAWHADQ